MEKFRAWVGSTPYFTRTTPDLQDRRALRKVINFNEIDTGVANSS